MAAVDLTTHPGHLARRLQQAHYLLWNTMVSEEITSPQFAVLNALVAEPGLDQRTVGERVGLDRSTIAEVISRLSRRGLIDKVRDPQDGRRSLLRLTDEGTRVHRKLTVRTARMNQIFLAPLSADEQAVFFDLIQRVSTPRRGSATRRSRSRRPDGGVRGEPGFSPLGEEDPHLSGRERHAPVAGRRRELCAVGRRTPLPPHVVGPPVPQHRRLARAHGVGER